MTSRAHRDASLSIEGRLGPRRSSHGTPGRVSRTVRIGVVGDLPSTFLSAHACTVYVLHPVVLVAVGHALSGVQVPAVAKFALLAVLAVPLCWVVAFPVRGLPGARK
jgi:hypothetical protein